MWVKKCDESWRNAKLRRAGWAARGLDDAAICYAAEHESDGWISVDDLDVLAAVNGSPPKETRRLAARLVEVGRWQHDPDGGGWWIHDFLEYNPSAAELAARRERRRSAAAVAGRASGEARRSRTVEPSANDDERTSNENVHEPSADGSPMVRPRSNGNEPRTRTRIVNSPYPAEDGGENIRPTRSNGLNPRALGTNPRAVAARSRAQESQQVRATRERLRPFAASYDPGPDRDAWLTSAFPDPEIRTAAAAVMAEIDQEATADV